MNEYGEFKSSWADRFQYWRDRNVIGKRCHLCGKWIWPWQGHYRSTMFSKEYLHPKCKRKAELEERQKEHRERFEQSLREAESKNA